MSRLLDVTADAVTMLTETQMHEEKNPFADSPPNSARGQPGTSRTQTFQGEPPHRSVNFQRDREEGSGFARYSLPKLLFPQFDGENPKIWIDKCEDYFKICNVQQHMWVTSAALNMGGNAAKWYQVYKKRHGVTTWPQFVQAMEEQFGAFEYKNAITKILELQ
ncbi:uncharacterized protein C2845_PM01G03290 [Panicum miliaceum]|uniref:Retrotransposon gag domain-containing protein n=1 Tax=Panicum miliaceum TaxID=4540 RepID=A0A3L6TIZ5_PANMI|nr:uncharacterized protein C2845_PM01G03290 [Panicum miliaceum]